VTIPFKVHFVVDIVGDVFEDDAAESIGDSVGYPAGRCGKSFRDSSEDSVNLLGLEVV